MGISPVTVAYHAKTLMRYDLVDRYPAGQTLLYQTNEVLERWVIDVGEGFKWPWENQCVADSPRPGPLVEAWFRGRR